jgi:hypothetical protein
MLKKSVFVLAIALLSVGAYARDYVTPAGSTVDWEFDGATSERKAESYNWPATYDYQDICVIPVKMDVGFWIKVNGCKDLVLNLKQVEIHKYAGTVDVSIVSNVNIKLSVSWSKLSSVNLGGSYGNSVSVNPSSLAAPGGTVTISLTLTSVDLSNLVGGQNCLQVGTVTLKVRPDVTPVLAGC